MVRVRGTALLAALFAGGLALALVASAAQAQQFAPAPEPQRVWDWRAWVFSSATAARDYDLNREDRPGLGAYVSRSLGEGGITAALGLRSAVDVTGERSRTAFLTLTVPLFSPRDPPTYRVPPLDLGGLRRPYAPAAGAQAEASGLESEFMAPRLNTAELYAAALGMAPIAPEASLPALPSIGGRPAQPALPPFGPAPTVR